MFCSKCGLEINEGSRFCKNCGNPIKSDTKEETPVNTFKDTPKLETGQKPKVINCSNCGKFILRDSVSCPHCKVFLTDTKQTINKDKIITNVYAGFWRRFLAAFIDGIILFIGGAIIGFIFGGIIGFVLGALGIDIGTIKAIATVIGFIIGLILGWLYYTLLESSSRQATLGKMAIGIIVTDLNNDRISFGNANGRYWGKIVSAIILGIGFMMAGFTQKKQALHDIMAGTLVVKK